jgi:hypothetical protein
MRGAELHVDTHAVVLISSPPPAAAIARILGMLLRRVERVEAAHGKVVELLEGAAGDLLATRDEAAAGSAAAAAAEADVAAITLRQADLLTLARGADAAAPPAWSLLVSYGDVAASGAGAVGWIFHYGGPPVIPAGNRLVAALSLVRFMTTLDIAAERGSARVPDASLPGDALLAANARAAGVTAMLPRILLPSDMLAHERAGPARTRMLSEEINAYIYASGAATAASARDGTSAFMLGRAFQVAANVAPTAAAAIRPERNALGRQQLLAELAGQVLAPAPELEY